MDENVCSDENLCNDENLCIDENRCIDEKLCMYEKLCVSATTKWNWLQTTATMTEYDTMQCQVIVYDANIRCFRGLYHAMLDLISGVDQAPGRPGGPRPDVGEILIEA